MTGQDIAQIAIAITGILASILIAYKIKWGPLIAFLGQPFWFYSAYTSKQWGIFIVTILYTFTWGLAVWRWFRESNRERGESNKI